MSLALLVDVGGGADGQRRATAAVGAVMTAALLLAALEQYRQASGGRWWLALVCALAAAGWCLLSCRLSNRRPLLRLQVTEEGLPRLICLDSGESVDTVFVRGWSLGSLIWLQLRPLIKVDPAPAAPNARQSASAFGGGDCRFLLARLSFDEPGWQALRRWLVWQGRSRGGEAAVA